MPEVFIACDQALANTGFAIVSLESNGKLKLLSIGTVKTNNKESLYQRISKVKAWLRAAIEEYKPKGFFVEEVFSRHGSQQLKGDSTPLIRIQTVICLELYEQEIPFWIISSSAKKKDSWRKTLSIEGGAAHKKLSRDLLLRVVPELAFQPDSQKKFKVSEHSADAFCILIAGLMLHNNHFSNINLEALQGIIEI